MAIGNPVSYWYGTKEQYNTLSPHLADTLYFITDEQTIYKGDVRFAEGVEQLSAVDSSAPASPAKYDKYFDTDDGKIYVYDGTAWGNAYYPADGNMYYDKNAKRFVYFVPTYDGTTVTGGSMSDVYDAGVSGDANQGVSIQGTSTVTVANASVNGKGVVKIGDNINVTNNGVISVKDASTFNKGAVQLVDSTDDTTSTDKAVTPHYVTTITNTKQDSLTFDTTTGIELVSGTTVKTDIATVEEVVKGTTGSNLVDADGLTGALSVGQAVDVSCAPYNNSGSIVYVNDDFLQGFTATMVNGTTVGFYDTTNHRFQKFADGLVYLFIANVSGSGTVTPNGASAVALSDTPERIWTKVTAADSGYISASANATMTVTNWRQYEVTALTDEAIAYIAQLEDPDAFFRSTSAYSIRNKYLIKQDMVCPFIPTINMPDNSDLTVAAGLSYKIKYTNDNTHIITADTIPTDAYGWDTHIQMFIKGTSAINFQNPLVLMDALTPNAGHNLLVKWRNGDALVYVEDTDAGNIVTSTSGTTVGTLNYYITQDPGTGHENYIVFGAVTDGAVCDVSSVSVAYNTNVIGSGTDRTTITGTYNVTAGITINMQDLVISGSTLSGSGAVSIDTSILNGVTDASKLTVKNSTIKNDGLNVITGSTVSFSGINILDSTVSGDGTVILTDGATVTSTITDGSTIGNGVLGGAYIKCGGGAMLSNLTISGVVHPSGMDFPQAIVFYGEMTNVEITGNTTTAGNEGIMQVRYTTVLTNVSWHDNSSKGAWPGLMFYKNSTTTLDGCHSGQYNSCGGVNVTVIFKNINTFTGKGYIECTNASSKFYILSGSTIDFSGMGAYYLKAGLISVGHFDENDTWVEGSGDTATVIPRGGGTAVTISGHGNKLNYNGTLTTV